MGNKNLVLSFKEAQTLASLLDIAVKAGGLPVASSALFFMDKINKTFAEEVAGEMSGQTKEVTKVKKTKKA